jgi:hypothetical protein
MPRALVPIDGLQVSLCAVWHVIESIEDHEPFSPLAHSGRFVSRDAPVVTAVDGISQHEQEP